MNLGSSDDRKKIAAVAAFLVIASGIVYFEYFDTGTPTPSAPAAVAAPASAAENPAEPTATPVGRPAKTLRTAVASLDPTLHMDSMLVSEAVVYAGSGRNIFSPNSAPPVVKIPPPISPARNVAVNLPPQPPPGPPPPPPIDLKFFGFTTSASGNRQAFLLHNDDVYLASAGDVVMRRYRVITIDPKTIQVEDMQNNNRQTLPLLAN